jgi:hypothetical protein
MEDLRHPLRVYSIGSDSLMPLRLNPFQIIPGIPLGRHIDMLKAVFNASFSMGAGMHQILEQSIIEVYTDRGWSLSTSKNLFLAEELPRSKRRSIGEFAAQNPQAGETGAEASLGASAPPGKEFHIQDAVSALTPCLEDLLQKIDTVLTRKAYGETVQKDLGAALRSRVEGLMVGNKGLTLNTRRSTPLSHLFDGPAIIELENLGDMDEQAFVMALLFVLLFEYAKVRRHRGQSHVLQHLTLIEEAHRLLSSRGSGSGPDQADPRGMAVTMFTDALAEMRGCGEGFLIADQTPTQLAPQTLKNSNVKIVMRLNSLEERTAVGTSMNLTQPQIQYINNLSEGYAVVHDERIGEAVLIKVPLLKDSLAVEAQALGGRVPPPSLDDSEKESLFRHAGCQHCPSPCNYFELNRDYRLHSPVTVSLDEMLDLLLLGDTVQPDAAWGVWNRWRAGLPIPKRYPPEQRQGMAYCEATQAVYGWLETMLMKRRGTWDPRPTLTPDDRLVREMLARALSPLMDAWSRLPDTLDANGREQWHTAVKAVRTSFASGPPAERAACAACPARCRMKPFISEYALKLAKENKPRIDSAEDAEQRFAVLQKEIWGKDLAGLSLGSLALPMSGERGQASWLYCLLVHMEAAPESARERREKLLALLGRKGAEPNEVAALVTEETPT